MPEIDATPEQIATVKAILRRHVPDREVWAFGSRARWTAKEYSDLDLAILGDEPLPEKVHADLVQAFDDSDLPWKVDVVEWAQIGEKFKRVILDAYIPVRQVDQSGRHDWIQKTIGEIADVVGGSTPTTKDASHFNGEIPWLTPKDLSGWHPRYIARGERNLSKAGLASCSAQLLPKNSVLLSSRAPIGYLAIAANPIATNQGFRSLIVRPEYDHEFVYYWLSANVDELERHATGSTFKELSGTALKQIKISLPSDRNEQRAIAHILGALDDKIELNRRMSETLEAMARALFKSWFVDFDPVRAKAEGRDPGLPQPLADLFPDSFEDSELGEIPRGWEVKSLSELCSTQYGHTASAVNEPVGPKFLRVTDINKRNWIEWANVPHCAVDPRVRNFYSLGVGDIVVARMADPGKSAIIEEEIDAVFASYLVRLKATSLSNSYYLYGFLKSDLYTEYAAGAKSGSVQANMNARVIVGARLVVPSPPVVEQFFRIVLPLRQRLAASVRESRALAAQRDVLLPMLVSGALRLSMK